MKRQTVRILAYLTYIILLGFFALGAESLSDHVHQLFQIEYAAYYQKLAMLILVIYNILLGTLLALPHFIGECRQEGQWKIDWLPLLVVGLPAICILAAYLSFLVLPPKMAYVFLVKLRISTALIKLAGILSGFTLISSFGKKRFTPKDSA